MRAATSEVELVLARKELSVLLAFLTGGRSISQTRAATGEEE